MSLYFYVFKIKVKVWVDFKHSKANLWKAFIVCHKTVFSVFLYDMFVEPTNVDLLLMSDKWENQILS